MNTFRVVIFLLSSFGLAVSLVFLCLGMIVENLRNIIWKSLLSLGIMLAVCAGVLCQDKGIAVAEEHAAIGEMQAGLPEISSAVMPKAEYEGINLPEENVTAQEATNAVESLHAGEAPDTVETTSTTEAPNIIEATGTAEIIESFETVNSNGTTLQELQVHYIDVGQGDCTLITCGGQTMLIDAGDNNKGMAIQNYLNKAGVTQIDYVIGTHPDADHIGGMDVILTKFYCETIMMPEVSNDTNTYRDVIDAMNYRGYKNTPPVVGNTYSLGDATFTIVAPNGSYGDMNNFSIGIRLVHGNNRFLFLGDAEEEAESDILQNGLDISADVLKVAHHGSRTSTSRNFVNAVVPQYAVISCGEGNSYGHPSAEVLNTLREAGVHVYRTDEQGSIIAFSDGQKISFNCAPSETWQAGEQQGTASQNNDGYIENNFENNTENYENSNSTWEMGDTPPATEEVTAQYVLNKNTGVFHYSYCRDVKKMSERNKLFSNESRDKIIEQGYRPCQHCNP